MRNSYVGFAYSEVEVKSILGYSKKKHFDNMPIFTPTIAGQLELKRQGLPYLLYYHLQFPDSKIAKKLEEFYSITQEAVKYVRRVLGTLSVAHMGLTDILQIVLEGELVEVFYAYEVWQRLEKEYKPNKYLMPQGLETKLSGWHADYFSHAAIMADFFIPQNKLETYPAQSMFHSEGNQYKTHIYQWLAQWKKLSLLGQKTWYDLMTPQTSLPKSPRFLWFSAGFNLYYYHHVVTLLRETGWLEKGFIITDKQSLADEILLRKARIPFVPLSSFKSPQLQDEINREVVDLKNEMHKVFAPSKMASLFSPHLPEQLKKALGFKLKLVCEHYLSRTVERVLMAHSVIQKMKPKLLITTHDPGPSALPFVYAAKQANIPTMVLLHGLHQSRFSTTYESDIGIVWGGKMRDWYQKHLNKRHMYSLGFPFLDDEFKKNFKKRSLFSTKWNYPINVGVLVAFYVPAFGLAGYLDELFAAFSVHRDQFIFHVRSHPGQQLQGGKELAVRYNIQAVFNEKLTIAEFTKRQDIMVTWDTTALVWAMIYGKPLYFAPPWWGKGQIPVSDYGAAWISRNAKELVESIFKLPSQPFLYKRLIQGQRQFLEEFIGSTKGNAAQKYFEILTKLM